MLDELVTANTAGVHKLSYKMSSVASLCQRACDLQMKLLRVFKLPLLAQVRWVNHSSSSHLLLSTNDKTVKLWRVRPALSWAPCLLVPFLSHTCRAASLLHMMLLRIAVCKLNLHTLGAYLRLTLRLPLTSWCELSGVHLSSFL